MSIRHFGLAHVCARSFLRVIPLTIGLALLFLIVRAGRDPVGSPLLLPRVHAAPGSTLLLYDHTFSGDSFVWCLDRSCSMGWQGEIETMKAEVTDAIDRLSSSQEFSVVAFGTAISVWSSSPVSATDANKDSAIAWIDGLTAAGGDCVGQGMMATIDISNVSAAAEKHMFLVGDGVPACLGSVTPSSVVIAAITAANVQDTPIHTILITPTIGSAVAFYQDLADANGGFYIDPTQPPPQLFRRGDANDDGGFDIADPVFVLGSLFIPGMAAPTCLDAADGNDDGVLDVSDAIYSLAALFAPGSPPPPPPGPCVCGMDAVTDGLDCSDYASCP